VGAWLAPPGDARRERASAIKITLTVILE